MNRMGIVLAAGQGTRMKSKHYKVLHPLCGKPLVGHVVDALEAAHITKTVVVVGHGADQVRSYLGDRVDYVLQEEQLGTGHAVMQTTSLLQAMEGTTLVICGDTPLITADTINMLFDRHTRNDAAVTILSARMDDPTGYGRIIRDAQGNVNRVVEHKDCTESEAAVREINTGTFCFDNRKLFATLPLLSNENQQAEYYLTDCVGILQAQGETIAACCLEDSDEAIGVNDRVALAEAERLMRRRINRQHLLAGVSMIDPANTYIDVNVMIGADTMIHPGTILRGETVIGEDCVLGPNTMMTDCHIGDRVQVQQSTLVDAQVEQGATIGPYAYLRPGARIGRDVKIGDFVEVKNAVIGDYSKVSHLSYVGDAEVGQHVNIGCGAITVNYDGYHKHKTTIQDNAFVGSNVNLIAPVEIGKGAYVVAGSTITQNVEKDSLAIARQRQTNKPDYAIKIRRKFENGRS